MRHSLRKPFSVDVWDWNEVAAAAEMTSGQPKAASLHWLPVSADPCALQQRLGWPAIGSGDMLPVVPRDQLYYMFLLGLYNFSSRSCTLPSVSGPQGWEMWLHYCGLFITRSQVAYLLLPLKCNSLQRILACMQGLPH